MTNQNVDAGRDATVAHTTITTLNQITVDLGGKWLFRTVLFLVSALAILARCIFPLSCVQILGYTEQFSENGRDSREWFESFALDLEEYLLERKSSDNQNGSRVDLSALKSLASRILICQDILDTACQKLKDEDGEIAILVAEFQRASLEIFDDMERLALGC